MLKKQLDRSTLLALAIVGNTDEQREAKARLRRRLKRWVKEEPIWAAISRILREPKKRRRGN